MFDLLAFITGAVYGYVNPGKVDKGKLLKNGLMIGVGIGIVFAVINLFVKGLPGPGAALTVSIIGIVFLTVMFIIGTILGDFLAFRGRKKTRIERAAPPQPSRKVVPEAKIPSKGTVTQKCPHCGGDLSELSFYKLKAGNDVKCDYCDAIISGGK